MEASGYSSKIPHDPIDFSVVDRRYRATKRVLTEGDKIDDPKQTFYMASTPSGVAEIKYDRLLRDVTQIAENAIAFNEKSDIKGSPYVYLGLNVFALECL